MSAKKTTPASQTPDNPTPKPELSYAERSLLASAIMSRQYLTTTIVMMVIASVLSAGIIYMRPLADPLIVVGIIFGIFSPITLGVLTLMKGQETHLSMNSQFDKWVQAKTDAAGMRGEQIGAQQERDRKDVP